MRLRPIGLGGLIPTQFHSLIAGHVIDRVYINTFPFSVESLATTSVFLLPG